MPLQKQGTKMETAAYRVVILPYVENRKKKRGTSVRSKFQRAGNKVRIEIGHDYRVPADEFPAELTVTQEIQKFCKTWGLWEAGDDKASRTETYTSWDIHKNMILDDKGTRRFCKLYLQKHLTIEHAIKCRFAIVDVNGDDQNETQELCRTFHTASWKRRELDKFFTTINEVMLTIREEHYEYKLMPPAVEPLLLSDSV